jgi:phosphatidylinositol alpha-mannosyltransferase
MRAACERYVRQNRLEDVVFAGFVPYEELPRYYKTADVYCAPNTGHESFGIVLLEAMAAGTPIVASNIGGFADVVEDGVEGVLVPPRDTGALASAMDRLLSDAALREQMGRAGTVRAAPFAWDKVSAQVLDYYQELAGNGSQSDIGP